MNCAAPCRKNGLPAPAVSRRWRVISSGFHWRKRSLPGPVAASFLRFWPITGLRLRRGLPATPCHSGRRSLGRLPRPGMGSMFVGEPWLDLPPNHNQQADLSLCRRYQQTDFMRALALLQPLAARLFHDTAAPAASTLSCAANSPTPTIPACRDERPANQCRTAHRRRQALLPYIGNAPEQRTGVKSRRKQAFGFS